MHAEVSKEGGVLRFVGVVDVEGVGLPSTPREPRHFLTLEPLRHLLHYHLLPFLYHLLYISGHNATKTLRVCQGPLSSRTVASSFQQKGAG